MKTKLPTTIKFKKPRKAEFNITNADNELEERDLIISNVRFSGYHGQDCCEHVYADFEGVFEYKKQIEDLGKIDKLEIKSVKDAGFVIFVHKNKDRYGIFVSCHNQQNGYYSDELTLVIEDGEELIGKFDLEKIDDIN